jgi:guanylate kinase|tara:strand:+ start:647 stop:1273 length:627 start_codon:yes stop_codon:yes gene_type:complete
MDLTGNLYVISAPSGAGKTSLVNELLRRNDDLHVAISHTTRPQRPNEVNGEDYHFVSQQAFALMQQQDLFLEHAEVFGYLYGTSKQAIDAILAKGKDIILEIDWQGAAQIRRSIGNCTTIFILPPSKDALYRRLTSRGQDEIHIIDQRMNAAIDELSHLGEFDYLVINDQFESAILNLVEIIRGECAHLSTQSQQIKLHDLITELLSE